METHSTEFAVKTRWLSLKISRKNYLLMAHLGCHQILLIVRHFCKSFRTNFKCRIFSNENNVLEKRRASLFYYGRSGVQRMILNEKAWKFLKTPICDACFFKSRHVMSTSRHCWFFGRQTGGHAPHLATGFCSGRHYFQKSVKSIFWKIFQFHANKSILIWKM